MSPLFFVLYISMHITTRVTNTTRDPLPEIAEKYQTLSPPDYKVFERLHKVTSGGTGKRTQLSNMENPGASHSFLLPLGWMHKIDMIWLAPLHNRARHRTLELWPLIWLVSICVPDGTVCQIPQQGLASEIMVGDRGGHVTNPAAVGVGTEGFHGVLKKEN